jgi:hypothetical protein
MFFVLVALYVPWDELKWQPFPYFTKGHDFHVPGVEFFLGLEEAGIIAVRRDTQVIRRLDLVVTNVMSQGQEKGHAAVPSSSVGLHWVASRNTFVVPYDFVFRSKYPPKRVVVVLAATGD